MPVFTDQLGRPVNLQGVPQRIVSIVPSQTELLFDLGLDHEVAGITKFCVHPKEWHSNKTRIGGTKNLNLEKIRSLQPQLIIANKEENEKLQVEALEKEFPVWISDIHDLDTALSMIASVGAITAREAEAEKIISSVRSGFHQLNTPAHRPRTAYLIWRKPWMTIGGDTFINDMLDRAGFDNIYAGHTRYPEINIQELDHLHCELLLLSSEPYPFRQQHIEELQHLLPQTLILLVDGEMFSWYGSRLLKAADYFKQLQIQVLSLINDAAN